MRTIYLLFIFLGIYSSIKKIYEEKLDPLNIEL